MKYNREKHHRRSIRLKNYDYASVGAYYVTICTKNRECLFGNVADGKMVLNEAGGMVRKWWIESSHKFTHMKNDYYIIMPNHFHGIILIVGADLRVCPGNDGTKKGAHTGAPLHRIIQWFKTMTTNEYLRNIKLMRWPRLNGTLWQRNYYEHIIRNEHELHEIMRYIQNNPAQWDIDKANPVYL